MSQVSSAGLADALTVAVAALAREDGTVLYANAAFGDLLSVAPADAVGRTLDDVFGESGAFAEVARTAVTDGGTPTEVELRGRCPDGRPVWVLAAARHAAVEEEPDALVVAFRDASLRRQLESELSQLAEFPEMNPGPVVRLAADGAVALANAAAKRLFGKEDLVGSQWLEICRGMDRDMWAQILASPTPLAFETEVGDVDVLFTYVHRDEAEYVFAFGADITERRQAERQVAEQSAALAEVARFPDMNPGPVLRLDLSANVLLANAAARDIFGDLTDRCWRDICPGLDEAIWAGILEADGPVPLEARIDDRSFIFHHRRDTQAELVFVFGADVSLQKQAEMALRQSEKMATLGTLVAGVAHELNNPAAATRRAAEQLREELARLETARRQVDEAGLSQEGRLALGALETRAREAAARPRDLDPLERSDREAVVEDWLEGMGVPEAFDLAPSLVSQGLGTSELSVLADALDEATLAPAAAWIAGAFPVYALLYEIGEGSTRISEIVQALKSYSYLGQAPLQEIDLHEGLDNTLVILRNKLKVGVTVRREYCTDMPPISAYGSELNQVWTNLIDNAVDAMDGHGELTIRTRHEDGWAVVEIEDQGPGIPEEIQAKIFDPFFTTKEPGRGTGLGLSTSYAIVTEKHEGTMGVESRPGFTRFTVRLPARGAGG